jgi:hypothetical protein
MVIHLVIRILSRAISADAQNQQSSSDAQLTFKMKQSDTVI